MVREVESAPEGERQQELGDPSEQKEAGEDMMDSFEQYGIL